jgi:hypothetical protein
MSFSVFDEEPRVLVTTVIHDLTKDWVKCFFKILTVLVKYTGLRLGRLKLDSLFY